MTAPTPASRLAGLKPYSPPSVPAGDVLRLDANEGSSPSRVAVREMCSTSAEAIRTYPDASGLEADIARGLGIEPERVVVTNGGDDAIDRVCRAIIGEGDVALLHSPTFEMIPRGVRLAGGHVESVDWLDGDFPIDAFLEAINPSVRLVAIVSPNNPTGQSIPPESLARIVEKTQSVGSVLMVDLAYVEFAGHDPQHSLLEAEHAVTVRTFSKAFGMAGLRVGYAVTTPLIAGWLRTVGGPFPVAAPSLRAASAAQKHGPSERFIDRVRSEREILSRSLASWGVEVIPSDANFLLASVPDANDLRDRLLRRGVAVRSFGAERAQLAGRLRITLPGEPAQFARLLDACRAEISTDLPTTSAHTHEAIQMTTPNNQSARSATIERTTRETDVRVRLDLDNTGPVSISTGLAFFDHMLTAFATHSRIGLDLSCTGDLEVDDHHTIEDCALAIGSAVDEALGERVGIERFAHAYAPLDESLARVVIDLSGRPASVIELGLVRDSIGPVATENLTHFFRSFATASRMSLHVDVLRGENDHHRAEAAFKALALAFRGAIAPNGSTTVPSTKGVL